MICKSCHHAPSERTADHGATCYCECHDAADAAPALLAACEWLLEVVEPNDLDGSRTNRAIDAARAAIAAARPAKGE